jgi:Chlorophyll A-B binding protein
MNMKTFAFLSVCLASATAFAPVSQQNGKTTSLDLTRAEIMSTPNTAELGKVFDPLGLSELGSDETISWFRHSEVKHGRIAMFAFVGACINGLGVRFPGEIAPGIEFSSLPKGGIEAWDALPGLGKAQLLIFAFLAEFHDELFYSTRSTHYMRGGVPGKVRA